MRSHGAKSLTPKTFPPLRYFHYEDTKRKFSDSARKIRKTNPFIKLRFKPQVSAAVGSVSIWIILRKISHMPLLKPLALPPPSHSRQSCCSWDGTVDDFNNCRLGAELASGDQRPSLSRFLAKHFIHGESGAARSSRVLFPQQSNRKFWSNMPKNFEWPTISFLPAHTCRGGCLLQEACVCTLAGDT
jgi:hypothetical protein